MGRTAVVAERREAVLDILRSNPRQYISSCSMSDKLHERGFDVSDDVARLDVRYLMRGHREIVSEKGSGYMWQPERGQAERYPENKTDEGVNDPTAFAAMQRCRVIDCSPKAGEVWEMRSSVKDDPLQLWLGIQEMGDFVYAVKVGEKVTGDGFPNEPDYQCYIENKVNVSTIRLVDVRTFRPRPMKYFKSKLCDISIEDFCQVKDLLAEMLGIVVVDHETAPEPVKEEVPAEKELEDARTELEDAMNLMLLKQERDIYKSIVDRFLEAKC